MSLDAIGIVSRDLKKSIQFYGLLGVKMSGDDDHFEGKTSSGLRLMLDNHELMKQLNPLWKTPTGSGVIMAFKQTSPKQVDQLYKTIIESGYKAVKEPWDAFWGQRYASVLDPDGNQIDLFAAL